MAATLRKLLQSSTLLSLIALVSTPSTALAAPQTWYFEGIVSAVDDVNGNGADDPTFAAGGYAIGSPISGSVTIDPDAASPDYDDPAALNLSGPDDPQRGHYLDAVTDFELWIDANHQVADAFAFWSTTTSNPPVEGTVQTIDDEEMTTNLYRDYYKIQLPALGDEYTFVPPSTTVAIDRNGFEPIANEGDVVISFLLIDEWVFGGTSSLVTGDDMWLDLEGRTDLATFHVRLFSGQPPLSHDVRLEYTLTYLSATPPSQPPGVPLLSPGLAGALASGLAAAGAIAARGARKRHA